MLTSVVLDSVVLALVVLVSVVSEALWLKQDLVKAFLPPPW